MSKFPPISTELITESLEGYQHFISDNLEAANYERNLFDRIGPKIQQQDYFTLDQVTTILNWRTPAQPGHIKKNDRERVKLISKQALDQDDEEIRIHILTLIRGIAIPTASKILCVTFPERYPTLNRMSWEVLLGWKFLDRHYSFTIKSWMNFLDATQLIMKKYDLSGRLMDQVLIATYLKHGLKLNLQNFIPLDKFF